MKILRITMRAAMAVCILFLMSNASCELFDKVDDVTFNVVLEHPFVVDEQLNSNGSPVPYSDNEIVDAAKVSSEFAQYKDKIQNITVNKITYVVSDYAAPNGATVTFSNGQLGFSAESSSASSIVASLAFQDIQAAQGTEHTLNINQAGLDEIAAILKDNKIVRLFSSGTLSSTPVAFKVRVKLDCTLTADAL